MPIDVDDFPPGPGDLSVQDSFITMGRGPPAPIQIVDSGAADTGCLSTQQADEIEAALGFSELGNAASAPVGEIVLESVPQRL